MTEAPKLKIGDTIWFFNQNRRKYNDAQSGSIWRYHWEPQKITGETSRSWLTNRRRKAPKCGAPGTWAFSEAEIDDQEWRHAHRYRIRRSCRGGLVISAIVLYSIPDAQRCAVAFETPKRSASAAWLYNLAFLSRSRAATPCASLPRISDRNRRPSPSPMPIF